MLSEVDIQRSQLVGRGKGMTAFIAVVIPVIPRRRSCATALLLIGSQPLCHLVMPLRTPAHPAAHISFPTTTASSFDLSCTS